MGRWPSPPRRKRTDEPGRVRTATRPATAIVTGGARPGDRGGGVRRQRFERTSTCRPPRGSAHGGRRPVPEPAGGWCWRNGMEAAFSIARSEKRGDVLRGAQAGDWVMQYAPGERRRVVQAQTFRASLSASRSKRGDPWKAPAAQGRRRFTPPPRNHFDPRRQHPLRRIPRPSKPARLSRSIAGPSACRSSSEPMKASYIGAQARRGLRARCIGRIA